MEIYVNRLVTRSQDGEAPVVVTTGRALPDRAYCAYIDWWASLRAELILMVARRLDRPADLGVISPSPTWELRPTVKSSKLMGRLVAGGRIELPTLGL